MKIIVKIILILCVSIILLIGIYLLVKKSNISKDTVKSLTNSDKKLLDQEFYDYKKVFPFLEILKDNRKIIRDETDKIAKKNWNEWPEQELWDKNKMEWTVFPFYGFNKWASRNCEKWPKIYEILKKIPNLQTALLSRFKPNTNLTPHRGWAKLSNNVLRCHYGIMVPENCIVSVNSRIEQIKENEITVFDDSKTHSACNYSNKDRIVLILDITRPSYIKPGDSNVNYSLELNNFVNELTK